MSYCFQCGKEVPKENKFCLNCGTEVTRTAPKLPEITSPVSTIKPPIIDPRPQESSIPPSFRPEIPPPLSESQPSQLTGTRVCRSCGYVINPGDKFCGKCLAKVVDDPKSASAPYQEMHENHEISTRSRSFNIVLGFGIFVVCSIVFFILGVGIFWAFVGGLSIGMFIIYFLNIRHDVSPNDKILDTINKKTESTDKEHESLLPPKKFPVIDTLNIERSPPSPFNLPVWAENGFRGTARKVQLLNLEKWDKKKDKKGLKKTWLRELTFRLEQIDLAGNMIAIIPVQAVSNFGVTGGIISDGDTVIVNGTVDPSGMLVASEMFNETTNLTFDLIVGKTASSVLINILCHVIFALAVLGFLGGFWIVLTIPPGKEFGTILLIICIIVMVVIGLHLRRSRKNR